MMFKIQIIKICQKSEVTYIFFLALSLSPKEIVQNIFSEMF